MIDACGSVEIGDQNMFGPDVYITDSNHRFGLNLAPNEQPMHKGKVKIGNRCWIGAKAVILKDVELGDGCVIGAGAVVTRSVPAGMVAAGVPAKPLHVAIPTFPHENGLIMNNGELELRSVGASTVE
jgi:maltose O-acetyltransferase